MEYENRTTPTTADALPARENVAQHLEALAEAVRQGLVTRLIATWDGQANHLEGEITQDLGALAKHLEKSEGPSDEERLAKDQAELDALEDADAGRN